MDEPSMRLKAVLAMSRVESEPNQAARWIVVRDVLGAVVYALLDIAEAIREDAPVRESPDA
jgi:hypothetical protein